MREDDVAAAGRILALAFALALAKAMLDTERELEERYKTRLASRPGTAPLPM